VTSSEVSSCQFHKRMSISVQLTINNQTTVPWMYKSVLTINNQTTVPWMYKSVLKIKPSITPSTHKTATNSSRQFRMCVGGGGAAPVELPGGRQCMHAPGCPPHPACSSEISAFHCLGQVRQDHAPHGARLGRASTFLTLLHSVLYVKICGMVHTQKVAQRKEDLLNLFVRRFDCGLSHLIALSDDVPVLSSAPCLNTDYRQELRAHGGKGGGGSHLDGILLGGLSLSG